MQSKPFSHAKPSHPSQEWAHGRPPATQTNIQTRRQFIQLTPMPPIWTALRARVSLPKAVSTSP